MKKSIAITAIIADLITLFQFFTTQTHYTMQSIFQNQWFVLLVIISLSATIAYLGIFVYETQKNIAYLKLRERVYRLLLAKNLRIWPNQENTVYFNPTLEDMRKTFTDKELLTLGFTKQEVENIMSKQSSLTLAEVTFKSLETLF